MPVRLLLVLGTLAGFSVAALAQSAAPGPVPGSSASPDTSSPGNAHLLDMLKEKALVFNVKASIGSPQGVLWSADQTRVTVHGLSVTIRMESSDLLILAELTPYQISSDSILLVIRNELWLRLPANNTVQYFASFKSAQVKLNDPVYFYPLGKTTDAGRPGIRMEITVNPWRETKD